MMKSKSTFALSRMIPYSSHITPEIIKVKGGSYLMCFKLHGVSYIGKQIEEVNNRANLINQSLMRLRAPTRFNLYIHTHAIRAEGVASLEDNFPAGSFAEALNQDYLNTSISTRPIIQNEYYISVIYRAYKKIGHKSVIKTTQSAIAEHEALAEEELNKIKDRFLSEFAEYDIKVLSCYDQLNSHGHMVTFSEVLQFLNRLVNFDSSPVPIMNAQISEYLPTATLSMGSNDYIKIENNHSTKYASIISIVDYPDSTYTGMLQPFLEQPYQMIVSQIFVPIDKAEASGWLKREFNRAENTDESSEADLQDLIDAREGIQSDSFVLGQFYWSAMLIADSIEKLRKIVSQSIAILSSCGFNVSPNRLAKLASYCTQFPANLEYRPREAKLSSENVVQMMPFLIQNHGKPTGNPWGSAVSMFRTPNDEIFYFSFHDGEKKSDDSGKLSPGNTVISGQTGTGKTVLLSFLLAQTQRFAPPPKTIIFDMDLGSSVFVKAMGGQYSEIKLGQSTGFNPFHLENNSKNRAFLKQLILSLLQDGAVVTAKEGNDIDDAIIQTLSLPKDLSDIEAFANYLPDGDNSIRQRLRPWTTGEFAWVFNNKQDNFSLNATVIGIDYTQFLDIKAIRSPLLMYLFHRIELMLDGSPFIISMDEAWKPLQDKEFQKFIEKKERTIRKENGVLILTTQSPGDFYKNVPEAIMQQVVTQIFLPNPSATREVYIDKVGLHQEEYDLIRGMAKNSREFIVRYQGETTHCRLNLKGVRGVDVLSGSAARAELANELIEKYGDDWLEHYYEELPTLTMREKES